MFYRFAVALVLPFLLLQISNANGVSSRVCNNSNVTTIGIEYFRIFDEAVKDTLDITHENNLLKRIVGPMFKYVAVANESCYHDTFSRERDGVEFHKFMRFSMTHGFREFINDGGVKCITAIKDEIKQCVKNIVGIMKGANDKFHVLWKAIGLDYGFQKEQCRQVVALKNCTQNAIQNEGYYKCGYEPNVSVYVGSLFEYMIERCKRLKSRTSDFDIVTSQFSKIGDHNAENSTTTVHSSTNILLGIVITLLIMLLAYIVTRDCRASKNSWNELFSLGQRGPSPAPLNNEN